jgi:hypothetical protein
MLQKCEDKIYTGHIVIGINKNMKPFYPTYLYIKTHNTTGLKYFGKTTGNPFEYRGSGKHWLSHIKKHGYDVSTEVLGYYTTPDECKHAALKFSQENHIVESKNWANMIDENGLDGGDTQRKNYTPHSIQTKRKISESNQGHTPWNKGKIGATPGNRSPRTPEQKEKISRSLYGRSRSQESISKTADKLRGRKRPDVADKLRGIKRSPETIAKMKAAQQNKGPMSEETKNKIRKARQLQMFTEETKEKLKGKIVCINSNGEIKKISKEVFYSQHGSDVEKEWVFHKSIEGIKRKQTNPVDRK